MKAPLVPKQQCTGNPNCSFNGGEDECGNWAQDCGDSDGSSFRVLGPTCEAGAPSTISQIQIKPAGPYAWTDISSTSVDSPTFLTMYDNLNTGMTIRWPTPTTDTMTDYYEVYVWNSDYINNPNPNVVFSSVLANASGLGWGACWADGTICKYRVNRNAGFSWHQQVYEAKYTTNSYRPNKLAIAIRGINSDCPAPPTPPTPGGYNLKYFDLVANISGRFYEIAGSCPSTTTTLAPLSGGINRNLTWNNAATSSNALNTVSNSFSYVMQAPYTPSGWGTHTLGLTIDNSAADPEDYYLIAPSCQNPLVNKLAPSNNNNFYVTKFDISNASWWQVINGLAYAGGIMNSTIPDTCGDSTYTGCINAVSIKEKTSAHDKSAAPPLTGQGSIEAGDGDYSETSNDVKSTGLNFSAVNNAPEDYEHFTSKVNLADGSKITTIGSSSISSLDISPNRIYSDTTRIYSRQGNLTISSGATISVPANEKKVVFVDGNLTINPATFDVPQSSYLGFIVSGDITFAKEVGHTIDDSNLMSDLAPNVSGVFIADRIIIAGETNTTVSDKKFIGEGTFVGWQGINLNRDFDDSGTNRRFNNGSPTESFIYRPAYLETTPTFMKAPGLFWQEVN
jgi:hypothetical protein